MTVGLYVPSAVPRFDETKFSGSDGGIAENLGMVGGVHAIQAARPNRAPTLAARVDVVL